MDSNRLIAEFPEARARLKEEEDFTGFRERVEGR
jgi:hypothetical protein